MKAKFVKNYTINEAIKHLAPRSTEEVWKYYRDEFQKNGTPLSEYPIKENKEFLKISKMFNSSLDDLFLISNDCFIYDILSNIFWDLVEGKNFKTKIITVKWTSVTQETQDGKWVCYEPLKLAYWNNYDDFDGLNAWIFSKKFFENYKVNEQFDSPGAKAKYGNVFSKEDMRDMTYPQEYHNLFQYGSYHGEDSGKLNDLVNKTLYKNEYDVLGTIETLYRNLISKLPEFKDFKGNLYNPYELRLTQTKHMQDNVTNVDYRVQLSLNIKVHKKNDKDLGYQKGKIRIFFSPDLTANPRNNVPWNTEIPKNLPSLSLSDDNLTEDEPLERSLQGFPDREDYQLCKDLTVSYKNLTLSGFLQKIPKLKEAIRLANKYFKEKYGI